MSCQNTMPPLAHYQSENVLPMYVVSMLPLNPKSSQYTIYHVHFQTEYHCYCPCTFSTPLLLPKFNQYITSPCHVTISPAHVHSQCHLSCQCSVRILHLLLTVSTLSCTSPVSSLPLLPKSSQKSTTSYSCPVSTILFLPSSSQNTTSSAHVQVVHQLSCSWPVRIPLPLSMSSQFTVSPAHIQSVHLLYFSCPVSTPTLPTTSSQYATSAAQDQSVHCIIWPCPLRIPPFLSMPRQYTISTGQIIYYQIV